MPLIERIAYLEGIRDIPHITSVDIPDLIHSYAKKNKLLKKRLQDKVPILESLKPTFQKALDELPKTWWNSYASDFLNSEDYQQPITDLANLVNISGEGYNIDWIKDYSFIICHPQHIKNELLRGLWNGIMISAFLIASPLILTCNYPQIYYYRKIARLTFEENNKSPIIRDIKYLEQKISTYTNS
ncbi:MAG: hypothetical protein AABX54_03025 [Nanoarchaeota archaeon]